MTSFYHYLVIQKQKHLLLDMLHLNYFISFHDLIPRSHSTMRFIQFRLFRRVVITICLLSIIHFSLSSVKYRILCHLNFLFLFNGLILPSLLHLDVLIYNLPITIVPGSEYTILGPEPLLDNLRSDCGNTSNDSNSSLILLAKESDCAEKSFCLITSNDSVVWKVTQVHIRIR
jgi:hypothetical protein